MEPQINDPLFYEDVGITNDFLCPCNVEYFMESARVRTVLILDLWRIRNRTSERSERLRFLIYLKSTKRRVCKHCIKNFLCGIVFHINTEIVV